MKAKSQLAEKNPQAMPWSNLLKRAVRKDREIKKFVLEEMTVPDPTPGQHSTEEQPLGTELVPEVSPYDEGYEKGVAEGEARGLSMGQAMGFTDGEAYGLTKGEAKGFAEGQAKGFAEGEAKGFADGEVLGKKIREEDLAEYNQLQALLIRLLDDLKDVTETVVSDAENDVLHMVLAIAQKIVRTEITQNPEILPVLIQEALKTIAPTKEATIRIAPQAVDLISRKSPELLAAAEQVDFLRIEADSRLQPGDCIVETEERIVDIRPESQLAEIEKKLLPPL